MTPEELRPKDYALSYEEKLYYSDFAARLERRLGPSAKIEGHIFPDSMPLFQVGKKDQGIVNILWFNGDTWKDSLINILMVGNAFRDNPDVAGPNTKELGFFLPFFDGRQDQRHLKQIPESINKAIVQSQSVTNRVVAKAMRHVAMADYVVTLDLHSHLAYQTFEQEGLRVINLSAARLFAERIKTLGLAEDENTVITTTDLGDIDRTLKLHSFLPNASIAIIMKNRLVADNGIDSTISQRLVYGDVKDKRVVLFDDMFNSGKTSLNAVDLVTELGASEIILCATHAIFTGEYYKNMQQVLNNPRVRLVMTTDSMPFGQRGARTVAVPYVGFGDQKKQLEVMPVGDLLVDAVQSLVETSDLNDAIEKMGNDVHTLRPKTELFYEITGQSYQEPAVVGVYTPGGIIEPLPEN